MRTVGGRDRLHRQWPVAGGCHGLALNEQGQSTNETRLGRTCGVAARLAFMLCETGASGRGMQLNLLPLVLC